MLPGGIYRVGTACTTEERITSIGTINRHIAARRCAGFKNGGMCYYNRKKKFYYLFTETGRLFDAKGICTS